MSVKLHIATLRIDGLPPHMSASGLKRDLAQALERRPMISVRNGPPVVNLEADVMFDEGVSRAMLAERIAAAVAGAIARSSKPDGAP